MEKILLIEDDTHIGELVSIRLKDLNCLVEVATDGREGYEKAISGNYSLIVLDIMLPGMDGLEVCRMLRADKINTHILMLTAKSEEIDKVLGLETGADDYLTKPFTICEFIARVKAILRRLGPLNKEVTNPKEEHLDYADVQMTDRVFQNIIDNAIKYCNPNDVVTIELELLQHTVKVKYRIPGKGFWRRNYPIFLHVIIRVKKQTAIKVPVLDWRS